MWHQGARRRTASSSPISRSCYLTGWLTLHDIDAASHLQCEPSRNAYARLGACGKSHTISVGHDVKASLQPKSLWQCLDFGIALSTRPLTCFFLPHGMSTRKQSRPKRFDVAHQRKSKRRDFFPWLFASKRWWCGTSVIRQNSSQESTFHSTRGTCGGDTFCTDALSCTRGHHRKLDRVQDGVTWSKVADVADTPFQISYYGIYVYIQHIIYIHLGYMLFRH